MPPVARIKDVCTGHLSFPATKINSGSNNTFVNGIPAARQSDTAEPHASKTPSPQHNRVIGKGSRDTFINGLSVATIGTPIECGGLIVNGSNNTVVN